MEKKPAKKAKAAPEYDSQRQQNVLLEKIYTEVKIIGEGHSGLNRGMGRIEDRLGGVDQRLDLIDAKLIQVDSRLTQVDSRLTQVDSRLTQVDSRLTQVDSWLAEHDKRFDRIEMVVTENRKDIKELKAGQEELKTDVKRLEYKLDTGTANHEQRIQKLESLR